MLLCTQLDEKTDLYVDCETTGTFDKSQTSLDFHPDDAIGHVVTIATGVASKLQAMAAGAGGDAEIDVEFGIKIDSNAVVSVARNTNDGQFRVRVRYGAQRRPG
jgi:hypothetical protein